ncbi:MAG: aldo/keto reductase [Candidatus Omnitrophica bacterium]|nr:aldo/keto reductase [Candidatus Omnitrophota bacterium]
MTRRQFLNRIGRAAVSLGLLKMTGTSQAAGETTVLPTRPLGRTGVSVTLFGLGGEGVMRSTGRMKQAVPVIRKALELGVNYFDTAPAYEESQDYLGEGLQGSREKIFLASKTHYRSRDGALKLLDNSLRRLRTDHLDLWQLHDLRDASDLEAIFARDGVIQAVEQARREGLIRFVGITGHYDPTILAEAARRYPFDTALVALNPGDRQGSSFLKVFLPVARERGMGVIGMKVMARGRLLEDPLRFSPEEALGYVLSLEGVSTAIVGCSSPAEVEANVRAAAAFQPMNRLQLAELEERARPFARQMTFFRKG